MANRLKQNFWKKDFGEEILNDPLMMASPPFIVLKGGGIRSAAATEWLRGGCGLEVFFVRLQQTTDAQLDRSFMKAVEDARGFQIGQLGLSRFFGMLREGASSFQRGKILKKNDSIQTEVSSGRR